MKVVKERAVLGGDRLETKEWRSYTSDLKVTPFERSCGKF